MHPAFLGWVALGCPQPPAPPVPPPMTRAEHVTRIEFGRLLREHGRELGALTFFSAVRNIEEGQVIFRAAFSGGLVHHWTLAFDQVDDAGDDGFAGWSRRIEREARSLYSRLHEDHLLELDLAAEREALDELFRIGAPAYAIERARREYDARAEHIRWHHRESPLQYAGVDYGLHSTSTVIDELRLGDLPPDTLRRVQERYQRGMLQAFGAGGGDPAAEAKGEALLREWLSPEQLASYEAGRAFEVIGSDSGKRYRIRHGRQMNIDELDAEGQVVCGWCFLPEGGLVAGDVMLAQKIALETDERAALKTANRFGGRPSAHQVQYRGEYFGSRIFGDVWV